MSAQEIRSKDPRDLIGTIHHYLNQHSAVALSYAIVPTDESKVPFANDLQKDLLFRLKHEIESIRELNNEMLEWLLQHRTP